ncbi:MAG: hypothetical protein GWP91_15810 [Rhodobacterales bacterium]|nr:hypothetical protein [Rhodobacterales bacterium]
MTGRLHVLGVHLPWDWKPGNYDLTLRLARLDRERRWGFDRYFSQKVSFYDTSDPRRHQVLIGALQSPGLSTQAEDHYPGPGGLVLEVNVR